ncbi:MAG: hypothetical protein C0490_25460, partial [Marivirga sp.]|nr:hypothetical protein [Marivirga sp.]
NASSGEILVRWTSPFDIDPIQYPPPYHYKVYRTDGLFDNKPFELLTQTALTDTIFIDANVNTQELPYRYKIELYVPSLTSLPVDTSTAASSVRLETTSLTNSIALTWDANTPWYNYAQKFPYHLIYRAENQNNNFVLIDSVNVNESGFNYMDTGKFQNHVLSQGTNYYYKVLTRGTYGNPHIQQRLENFSQIISSSLLDTTPPCAPIVTLEEIDCSDFSCSGSNYFNSIKWKNPAGDCANDVVAYNVYVSDETNTDFILLITSNENTYKHAGLTSRAKCYKVSAVDRAGNESELSNIVCSDNCPYFELPNIITPGNKDELNDFLSAFTAESNDSTKCARFVINVDVKIYDRWGGEIFSKNAIGPESNYILWDGLSNTGKEVSSGIYFYSANVQFNMHDPLLKFKKFNGWVHVVR